jgi:Flp pilus assembly protein TadD
MSPRQRAFLHLLAHLFLRHGQAEKALVLLRAACRLAPDDRQLLKALAYAELLAGDAGAALNVVERFGRAGGDTQEGSPVQMIRARALLQLGRDAEARDCFGRFVRAQTRAAGP